VLQVTAVRPTPARATSFSTYESSFALTDPNSVITHASGSVVSYLTYVSSPRPHWLTCKLRVRSDMRFGALPSLTASSLMTSLFRIMEMSALSMRSVCFNSTHNLITQMNPPLRTELVPRISKLTRYLLPQPQRVRVHYRLPTVCSVCLPRRLSQHGRPHSALATQASTALDSSPSALKSLGVIPRSHSPATTMEDSVRAGHLLDDLDMGEA
jgi:hypothetical protein